MPQRHSKNAGTMGTEALSYHERKALGFGTVKERLGKDAQGNFYDCNLTYAKAKEPMCTPEGFIYSKESILENLLAQKRSNQKKLKQWETEQQNSAIADAAKREEAEELDRAAFYRQNHEGATTAAGASPSGGAEKSSGQGATSSLATFEERERAAELKSFWLPSKTPEAAPTKVKKPSMECRCPASGKKLRLKDLFPLRFARDPEDGSKYIDPITKDELTNRDKLVALKPTGDVMRKSTYDKVVKPDGVWSGKRIDAKKDVVTLQKGGTGFAAHDKNAQASKKYLVGMGSGLADLRGQSSGPGSRFGLQFTN